MNKIGKNINIASEYILDGKLVVFPTETVYGIGADATNKEAVDRIFVAKHRPADNPLIVHICDYEMLDKVAKNIGEIEKKLMKTFWPGPISIILDKTEYIPFNVSAGLTTVAVRMPENNIALDFIKLCNTPIAAPSANISSKPSGTCVEDIYDELYDGVSYFIDGGYTTVGIESTVVKVIDGVVNILRPGKISKEDILQITDKVIIDERCLNKVENNEKVLSPGMKHKHYAPNAKCILVYNEDENKIVDVINKQISNLQCKVAVLVTDNNIDKIMKLDNIEIINLGKNLDEVSSLLFSALRKVDKLKVDICYIQGFRLEGIGTGIMNRLIRACSYNCLGLDL